jgi:hypothetical protein
MPATSLTTNPVVNKWYADYSETWMDAGCTNAAPYPTYAQLFDSQLAKRYSTVPSTLTSSPTVQPSDAPSSTYNPIIGLLLHVPEQLTNSNNCSHFDR